MTRTQYTAMRIKPINVSDLARLANKSRGTMYRWRRDNKPLFDLLVRGYLEVKFDEERKL